MGERGSRGGRMAGGRGEGCQHCGPGGCQVSRARGRGDALAAGDLVREVVLEADDGVLLQASVVHEVVELRREHGGDVVDPVGEHDAEALLGSAIFVRQRANICGRERWRREARRA